jgi:hypothetical protein
MNDLPTNQNGSEVIRLVRNEETKLSIAVIIRQLPLSGGANDAPQGLKGGRSFVSQ